MILCKLKLRSEEQYDYKFGFIFASSGVKRMTGCYVTSSISSIVAQHSGFQARFCEK